MPPVVPQSLAAWSVAVRPRSLLVAISPVLVGACLGYRRTGSMDAVAAVLALLAAVLMQLITNLQNDVGYTERGAEASGTRIGLPRATASGWLEARQVRSAVLLLSSVAVALGLGLVAYRGWMVLAMGGASLLAALAYMGGPRPVAYTPFGELTVFVFFGLVAVLGTDWLVTGSTDRVTGFAATSIGCLAAAALAVNNHRDRTHDAQAGRATFAVLWGVQASRRLLIILLAFPFAMQMVVAAGAGAFWLGLPCVLAPWAWRLGRDFVACPEGLAFNGILFRVFQFELWFSMLLSVGALLSAHPQAGV